MRFDAVEPADHSSNMLFMEGYDRFLSKLRKAKRVRIQAAFFQRGNHMFEFATEGLEWPGSKEKKK